MVADERYTRHVTNHKVSSHITRYCAPPWYCCRRLGPTNDLEALPDPADLELARVVSRLRVFSASSSHVQCCFSHFSNNSMFLGCLSAPFWATPHRGSFSRAVTALHASLCTFERLPKLIPSVNSFAFPLRPYRVCVRRVLFEAPELSATVTIRLSSRSSLIQVQAIQRKMRRQRWLRMESECLCIIWDTKEELHGRRGPRDFLPPPSFFGGGKKLCRSPAAARGVGSRTLLPHASGAHR
jgi:hypothetical protein